MLKLVASSSLLILCLALQATAQGTVSGDSDRGERLFLRCKACHTVTNTSRQRLGPTLFNLFSRKVGTLADYDYSRALQDADFNWSDEELDAWLKQPNSFLPGNRMAFSGFPKEKDRQDLIAYLKQATKP